ncbi:MAG: C40 family peptidase [Candidatus Protistobacter heckmanni]|nr:C40 family peptidase [Candidatus Protistobacter heckmanni]
MLPENQALALAHAKEEYPREACGLLVVRRGREVYLRCRNIGVGSDQFVLHPEDYAAADAQGEIVGVVHSHPGLPPDPSQADRVACEASGLPWHIVGIPSECWASIEPSGYVVPLVGRQWSHGVLDCYALVRDWFRQERGITLPNFARFDDWWKRGENLYLENFAAAGFAAVDAEDLQPGDCFLMQVASPVPNHAAVYLGDGLILHHLQGRLSSRDIYGGYWQKVTTHILRHVTKHGHGHSSR